MELLPFCIYCLQAAATKKPTEKEEKAEEEKRVLIFLFSTYFFLFHFPFVLLCLFDFCSALRFHKASVSAV